MAKKFKVKKKQNWFDKLILGISRSLKKKPKIINLNDESLPTRCIIIGNHKSSSGPLNYSLHFTGVFMTWTAHQMTEGFRNRWRYSYHIFYRQKIGYGKIKAFFMATVLAIFGIIGYNAIGVIPIYYDSRIFKTFKYSIECLENDKAVLIFPEDSQEGYKDVIEKLHPGFLKLAKLYNKKHNTDLPIYTMNYNNDPKKIVIGKPHYYQEMLKKHTDDEILEILANYMNSLSSVE